MRLTCFLLFMMLMLACNKNNGPEESTFDTMGPYGGVWVETSLQKDTINFNTTKVLLEQLPWTPPPNAAVFFMGSENFKAQDGSDKSPGGIYAYYRKPDSDSLFIYNIYLSNGFTGHKFQLNITDKTFTIDRFYDRPGLPDMIRFKRIR